MFKLKCELEGECTRRVFCKVQRPHNPGHVGFLHVRAIVFKIAKNIFKKKNSALFFVIFVLSFEFTISFNFNCAVRNKHRQF